jgi:hypothetical protein
VYATGKFIAVVYIISVRHGLFCVFRPSIAVAYIYSIRHGYLHNYGVHSWLYASGTMTRPVHTFHHTLVASAYPVRHGYGRSRGIHYSCMPPRHSHGIHIFPYASNDNSFYDLFPSSVIWIHQTLARSFIYGHLRL